MTEDLFENAVVVNTERRGISFGSSAAGRYADNVRALLMRPQPTTPGVCRLGYERAFPSNSLVCRHLKNPK